MPRSRNIKPSLFKNEVLGLADPLLTILFEGLWCLADREGRLEDRPLRIKAEIFPYRELPDFNRYLTELQRLGFIVRYSVKSTDVIEIINFKKHQSPHKTERGSELPERPLESAGCGSTVKESLNTGGGTVKEPLIPDSCLLIPDSLDKRLDQSLIDQEMVDHCFEQFWKSGMFKTGKKKSKPIFAKLLKTQTNPDTFTIHDFTSALCDDVAKRLKANQLGFAEMHPSTYLNGERWNDEIKQRSTYENSEGLSRPPKLSPVERVRAARKREEEGSSVGNVGQVYENLQ